MELRKEKEIGHYDKKAEEWLTDKERVRGDFERFAPLLLNSYKFCYDWLWRNCKNKIILDYGCGNGFHSVFLAKMGAEKVIGIDLSKKSLEIARERAGKEGREKKIEFILMDCEKMDFPDNTFDVIFDSGAFSSLDLRLALPELSRVLKKDGFLIGIETLGHNPFANFKRKINRTIGKRTAWAASHIFKQEDLEKAKDYFGKVETKFFHLVSWMVFPFLNLPGGKFLLRIIEKIDNFLLFAFPFLKKYCFKIVFVFSKPRK